MSNINTAPMRFENGGVITVDGDTVANVLAGSLKIKDSYKERILQYDRANIAAVFEGDTVPAEVEFAVYGDLTATALFRVVTAAGTGGTAKKHTIIIKVPDNPGAATGISYTFTNCWLTEMPQYEATGRGQDMDKITPFKFMLGSSPTKATY